MYSHIKTGDRVWNRSAQSVVVESCHRCQSVSRKWFGKEVPSHNLFSLLNRPISEGKVPESSLFSNLLYSWPTPSCECSVMMEQDWLLTRESDWWGCQSHRECIPTVCFPSNSWKHGVDENHPWREREFGRTHNSFREVKSHSSFGIDPSSWLPHKYLWDEMSE